MLRAGADRNSTSRLERLGLYHFALVLPDRRALGGFIAHALAQGVRPASADHAVSEATYLWDPDGLGIEVYSDRPRDAWRANGRELWMTSEPLNIRGLLEMATPWTGMPEAAASDTCICMWGT